MTYITISMTMRSYTKTRTKTGGKEERQERRPTNPLQQNLDKYTQRCSATPPTHSSPSSRRSTSSRPPSLDPPPRGRVHRGRRKRRDGRKVGRKRRSSRARGLNGSGMSGLRRREKTSMPSDSWSEEGK